MKKKNTKIIIALLVIALVIGFMIPSCRKTILDIGNGILNEAGTSVTEGLEEITGDSGQDDQGLTGITDEEPDVQPDEQHGEQPDEEVGAGDVPSQEVSDGASPTLDENGSYDDKENVALYILTYGKLPPNYISKKDAEALGWEGGSVERFAPGKCIGGTYFGNYESLLPKKKGREYHECDIDTLGKSSRGAKRIIYSNDGLIYYTDDHYETFELLYGEED